jgi:two-component system, NtrC family, response regulator AtoC
VRPLLLVLTVISSVKVRTVARMVLGESGHRVIEAGGYAQAHSLLINGLDPDLIICEISSVECFESKKYCELLKIAPADKICLIKKIGVREELFRETSISAIRHVLTSPVTRGDLESVVNSVSRSKGDPEPDFTIALTAENGSSEAKSQVSDNAASDSYVEELGGDNFFLAAAPRMLEIHRQVKLLADIDVNVLILGESGTGKEIIAKLIHKYSKRSKDKFLKVNCAALPADLLESELFGHRQGAFTGAIHDRAGKFEQANRGTLLLDEIGEIPVHMQAKLLHVLQDGQFARLGAQETTKVDVRVLAATNVEMESALLKKTFREDLYYRLSVFTIKVPPLRERREEIPFLIEEIIRRAPAEIRKGFGANLPSRLMDVAISYDWRGNLRELRNFVTRTMVMRDLDAATCELESRVGSSGSDGAQKQMMDPLLPCAGIRSIVRDVKERTEMEMIQNALEIFGWNRRRAAQYLNISYRSLLYKIQQHHLKPWFSAEPRQPMSRLQSTRQNAL